MSTLTARLISPSRRISLLRWAWRLDSPAGLVAMFAVALVIRVLIAPHVGFYGDLRLFRMWATRLDEVGPHRFYVQGQFADYPPGYLYVLWLIGKLSATPGYLLLKLPAILADLGLAWITGIFAVRLAPASLKERVPVRALAAAAVLFNPAVIAVSAVWGQVDAVPALFVLASLLLLFTGPQSGRREVFAFLLFAVSIAMKPQAGFVLPIMLYALYRRHLHRRPRSELLEGALRIAAPGVLALDLWFVLGIPFGLGPVELVRFYSHSASVYPVTSANAFNLWGAVGFWRSDSSGDHAVTVAGLSALHVGMLLFAIGLGVILWRLHRAIEQGADEARALTLAAAAASVLAYAVLTRMHERYMFLSLACLAPLVFLRPTRLALAGLSGLFLVNLWYPYAYFNSHWKVEDLRYNPWFDGILGGFATDTWQKKALSLAVTAIAILLAWRGIRWVQEPKTTGTQVRELTGVAVPDELRRQPSIAPAAPSASAREAPSREDAVDTQPAQRWTRWMPIALVALTCLFGLVILRGETSPAPNLNDSAFHQQMVRWADGQIRDGGVPLDGWYPYLSLGSAQFHHYQSLPHTLTAYAARATGASDDNTYLWLQYLLLALWPIAVYCGARLLGWGPWTAAAAAAVSPLIVSAPGYGYEHGSYTWRGYGVYSQLWGMWLLPIAWGLTWRAVTRGRWLATAAAALALTIACHFITGYLALLTVGVWVLVVGRGFLRRLGRAAIVAVGSLLVASAVLVPLVGDTKWTTRSEYYKGTFFSDSYGARKVLGWLFSGRLFDDGRFPIVTLLFYAGAALCIARARRDPRARALLGAFTLSLLLFFGRPTLGPLLDVLPGFGDIQVHRFVMGVHLAGILLAGVGLAWLARGGYQAARRLAPHRYTVLAGAAAVLLAVGVLAPAWAERAAYDLHGAELIRAQRAADATDGRDLDQLAAIVKARGDGRVYAGLRANWGRDFKAGYVPVYAWLADRDVDAIGFTFRTIASLSTDVEAAFDESNPAQYEMFNIRYLILPPDREPSIRAKLLASIGRYRLWEVKTSGYVQVVDRGPPVAANRTNLESATRGFRDSNLASRGVYPGVAFAGGSRPAPTFVGPRAPNRTPGKVITQSDVLRNGIALTTVNVNRRAVVLLKASYDPRWTVTVDGRATKPTMMAPSLVGIEVPKGRHLVWFRYKPYGSYPPLIAIGAIALLGLAVYPRLAVRRLFRFPRGRLGARERHAHAFETASSIEIRIRRAIGRGARWLGAVASTSALRPSFGLVNRSGERRTSDREQLTRVRNSPVAPSAPDPSDGVAVPPALSLRAYLTASRAIPLMIALAVSGMFLPVVIARYAFSDDYPVLFIADDLGSSYWFGSNIVDTGAASGRPIAGLLDELFFSAAGTIDNLRFVRLVAVVGIAALALLLHWALVRAGIKPMVAALFALLMCSMPAFQVYASWAVLFSVPYAALLGAGASVLAASAVDAPASFVRDRLVGATAMLLAALLIYQSAAMFFWVFLAIALVGAARDSGRALRLARTHFGIGAIALALAFLVAKLAVHLVGEAAPNPARNALTDDVIGKVSWFLRGPLYQSLNLFDLTPSPWLAVVVGAVSIGGILLLLARESALSFLWIGVAAVLIPLSFLPNLVVKENSPTYRVQVSLASLIVLYACLGALGIWITLRDRLRPRVSGRVLLASERLALGISIAFVATSAFVAANNVTTLMVEPQSTELRVMRSQVAALPVVVGRIAYVQIGWNQGLTKRYFSDELGVPSSARPWTPEPAVLLILREQGRLPPAGQRPVVDVLPWYTTRFPDDEPVVDLRVLERLR